ncbi:MAG TPA: hypothetical protein VL125_11995 [Pelobium sp.]|nr:hypothetical protein [Pelobium sp.]
MNEQFDRALRNHIRDTFDHYDDLMQDDGWKKFKKQKNRKKRGFILWYALPSGIAAALALLWIFNVTTKEIVKPENKFIAKNKVTEVPQTFKPVAKKPAESSVSDLNRNQELVGPKKTSATRDLNQHQDPESFTVLSALEKERDQIAKVEVQQKTFIRLQADYTEPALTLAEQNFVATGTRKHENQEFLAFNNDLIKNTDPLLKPASQKKEDAKKSKAFNFSVDANTYYSFTSAGVANNLNLGVGLLSELKLTKRLSVNSGISFNKQSAAIYQNSPDQSTNSQSFASPSSPNSLVSQISKQSISVPEEVQINAKLVGFDIPLNLKYNISLGKTKTFVTTGISSYSLLNQSYANDVSVINYSLTSEPTTTILRTVEKEKEDAFSNFQFARTVNFSFGILYPLSKKNSISVEPFVKYPIAGFGQKDLEIGSGGVSFKLNFGK